MKKLLNLDIKKPEARWELVKGALRARGSSLSAIALRMGLTKEAVGRVKKHPYPAVQEAIARELHIRASDLWPERYLPCGSPKRRRPNAPTSKPGIRKSAKANVSAQAFANANGEQA